MKRNKRSIKKVERHAKIRNPDHSKGRSSKKRKYKNKQERIGAW